MGVRFDNRPFVLKAPIGYINFKPFTTQGGLTYYKVSLMSYDESALDEDPVHAAEAIMSATEKPLALEVHFDPAVAVPGPATPWGRGATQAGGWVLCSTRNGVREPFGKAERLLDAACKQVLTLSILEWMVVDGAI